MTQIEYLEILFNDLQFDRAARNFLMSKEFGRPVHYLADLDTRERGKLIAVLRWRKKYGRPCGFYKPSNSCRPR